MSDKCKHDWFYDEDYRGCNMCGDRQEYPKLCGLMHDRITELEAENKKLKEDLDAWYKLAMDIWRGNK